MSSAKVGQGEATLQLNSLVARYAEAKQSLAEQIGASEALLHVHAGLLIFVVAALLLRRRLASAMGLVMVATFAVANEVADYLGPSPSADWHSVLDIFNTVFWPVVLFVLARRWSSGARR